MSQLHMNCLWVIYTTTYPMCCRVFPYRGKRNYRHIAVLNGRRALIPISGEHKIRGPRNSIFFLSKATVGGKAQRKNSKSTKPAFRKELGKSVDARDM